MHPWWKLYIWLGFPTAPLVEELPSCSGFEAALCGGQVAMVGLDQFITKNATLANEKADDAHTIKAMKFSVSPVVRVAVETKVRPCSRPSTLDDSAC